MDDSNNSGAMDIQGRGQYPHYVNLSTGEGIEWELYHLPKTTNEANVHGMLYILARNYHILTLINRKMDIYSFWSSFGDSPIVVCSAKDLYEHTENIYNQVTKKTPTPKVKSSPRDDGFITDLLDEIDILLEEKPTKGVGSLDLLRNSNKIGEVGWPCSRCNTAMRPAPLTGEPYCGKCELELEKENS